MSSQAGLCIYLEERGGRRREQTQSEVPPRRNCRLTLNNLLTMPITTFQHCISCNSAVDTISRELDPSYRDIYEDLFTKSRCNDMPGSRDERLQLQSLMERTSNDLQKHNDAIAQLQERCEMLAKIKAYQKSLVSPIRKLPSDILDEIFKLIAGYVTLFGVHESSRCNGAIFSLSWVCSSWRDLILSRPALWSHICFTFGHTFDASDCTRIMHELLPRAGTTTPLRILLDFGGAGEDVFAFTGLHHVLGTLTGYATNRLKDLSIRVSDFRALYKLLDVFCLRCPKLLSGPLLDVLELAIQIQDPYTGFEEPPDFFRRLSLHCPRLRILETPFLRPTDSINLRNLAVLRINCDLVDGYLSDLLEQAPFLQQLSLSSFHVGTHASSSAASCVLYHTHLTRLTISNMYVYQGFPTGVWDSVRLPNLTHLSASFDIDDEALFDAINPFDELRIMLKVSRCTLKYIYLTPVPDHAAKLFFQEVSLGMEPDSRFTVNGKPYTPVPLSP